MTAVGGLTGWMSPEWQERMFDDEVVRHTVGSARNGTIAAKLSEHEKRLAEQSSAADGLDLTHCDSSASTA